MFSVMILLIIAGKMNLPIPYLVAIYIVGGISFIVNSISLGWSIFKLANLVKAVMKERRIDNATLTANRTR